MSREIFCYICLRLERHQGHGKVELALSCLAPPPAENLRWNKEFGEKFCRFCKVTQYR